jgi:hypothetical protein
MAVNTLIGIDDRQSRSSFEANIPVALLGIGGAGKACHDQPAQNEGSFIHTEKGLESFIYRSNGQ